MFGGQSAFYLRRERRDTRIASWREQHIFVDISFNELISQTAININGNRSHSCRAAVNLFVQLKSDFSSFIALSHLLCDFCEWRSHPFTRIRTKDTWINLLNTAIIIINVIYIKEAPKECYSDLLGGINKSGTIQEEINIIVVVSSWISESVSKCPVHTHVRMGS